MPEFAKTNNHADKTQVPDANHSEVELPSNTFASTKMNLPTDSLHNKLPQAHAETLMVLFH